jgi:hypothetical protein
LLSPYYLSHENGYVDAGKLYLPQGSEVMRGPSLDADVMQLQTDLVVEIPEEHDGFVPVEIGGGKDKIIVFVAVPEA